MIICDSLRRNLNDYDNYKTSVSNSRNAFSIFSVWHRLTSLFDAVDDPRVPIFQTYIHVTAYVLTVFWSILRPGLTFRYSRKLRHSLCK